MKKKEFTIFVVFVFLSLPVAYFYSISSFNDKLQNIEQELRSRVKNIELIQSVLADMPSLLGSIEFQSYGQVDIIVEKLMSEDDVIKEFFVLDNDLNVLHSKQSNYDDGAFHRESFAGWNKNSPFINYQNQVYMLRQVGTGHGTNAFFILFRLSPTNLFKQKLADAGILGVSLKQYPEATPTRTFELKKAISGSAQVDAFLAYLMKNILGLAVLIIFGAFLFIFILRWLITPFREIIFYLQNLSNRNIEQIKLEHYPRVFKPFITNIIAANRTIQTAFQSEREIEIQQSKFRVAQQVAHDIRSPLEVLKGLGDDLQLLPIESKRRVQMSIQRIEEIAYNLLRAHKNADDLLEIHAQSEELLSIVESVIIEKKMEYSSINSIEISGIFDSNSYGLISNVRRGALKSVISNLVNNGIEALDARSGCIKIKLYDEGELNVIEVTDTGNGIPEEFKDKLFKRGFTNKETGNGLGLYGAKEEISFIGGRIDFISKSGEGTTFKIQLPKSQATSTFVKTIDVYKYQKIIVLDDDPAFHEFWRVKFEPVIDKVESYFSIKEIFHKYEELPPSCLLLSDFELMDEEFDGIDVILKYKTSKNSILVTARSEEQTIQERCLKEGIMLLSKGIINYVKFNFNPPSVILIDDDKLIRADWRSHFSSKGISFKCFDSVANFLEESLSIEKDSIIYIDSNLGNGLRGELESEKIYKLGFLNLFLATGYQKEDIEKPFWIKDIHSKNPRNIPQG